MQETLFSQHWYRVSELSPRLRADLVCSQHIYRRQPWYVVKGASYGSSLRVNAAAYHLMSQFNGKTTVGQIWDSALVTLGDDAPTQNEMIQLLSKLFDSGAVDFEHTSDLDQLFDNRRERASTDSKGRYGNPLFMRFNLFNPNRLAEAALPLIGWLFSRTTLIVWLVAMLIAVVTVAYEWQALSRSIATDLMTRHNLLILWFVFPIMKLIHELAHAVAIRRFGGEVKECGIAMLVLLPVPYVDGSDSVSFSSKYQRMAVAAAGIFVETGLAFLGLIVWLNVEPGLVRDIALNVMITGSVSSLLFNGNPLLKFDAYYVLSDALEMPNLASRSSQYPLYLIQRYILGLEVRSPATAPGERRWLLSYGILATLYRVGLTIVICLYVASHFFFIGVILALWALVVQVGKPLWRLTSFVFFDTRVGDKRLRVNAAFASALVMFVLAVFVFKVPHVTSVRGVVWPVDQAVVRTGTDCFVKDVAVANGTQITANTPLLSCEDAQLEAQLAGLRADYLIARATLDASRDRVDRQVLRTELEMATQVLRKAEEKQTRMRVSSALDGEVYFPKGDNLVGSFLEQGQLVGYVLNREKISIRTMLEQDRVELIDAQLERVDARILSSDGIAQRTNIVRRVPAASNRLSIAALGENGGGELLEQQSESGDASALRQAAFEVELSLPDSFADTLIGEPVELRFTHGSASVATLLYRKVQLLLLSKFNV